MYSFQSWVGCPLCPYSSDSWILPPLYYILLWPSRLRNWVWAVTLLPSMPWGFLTIEVFFLLCIVSALTIHSKKILRESSMCQPLFWALKIYQWTKQDSCPKALRTQSFRIKLWCEVNWVLHSISRHTVLPNIQIFQMKGPRYYLNSTPLTSSFENESHRDHFQTTLLEAWHQLTNCSTKFINYNW